MGAIALSWKLPIVIEFACSAAQTRLGAKAIVLPKTTAVPTAPLFSTSRRVSGRANGSAAVTGVSLIRSSLESLLLRVPRLGDRRADGGRRGRRPSPRRTGAGAGGPAGRRSAGRSRR